MTREESHDSEEERDKHRIPPHTLAGKDDCEGIGVFVRAVTHAR